MKAPLFFLTAVLSLLTFTAIVVKADPAPAWNLQDINGKQVKLSDFKGKVVILDFWATWCPPCRAEIPGFVELQKEYGSKGLVVVGVSLDDNPEVVASFAKAKGINYPIVMGTQEVAQAYGGIEAIPTTFVIDTNGNVVAQHQGYTDKAEFEAEITGLLPKVTAMR